MFIVDAFHDTCKRFNIKIQTALKQIQSYSGLMVNVKVINNQTLVSILLKMKDVAKYEFNPTHSGIVCAKSSLFNRNGFSPSKLVFG